MNSFTVFNPTKVIFGTDSFDKISSEIPLNANILITFGQGSVKTNGVYDAVILALKNHRYQEFWGIEPNPMIQTLSKALEIIKRDKIDYLFAVGGGSVIDGTKFLAAAALKEGDPWEILKKSVVTTQALPIATLLTLPATGSENNSGAVISNSETGEKLGMGGMGLFPVVSFLNPEVVKSISPRQLKNGLIDAYTHVIEQYMTYPNGSFLTDRFAESVMQTIIEIAPKLVNEPYDQTIASNFMWSCSMALNGLLNKGVPTDWSAHQIGHELTALYNIDHAMTLAIIFPNIWKYKFENKKEKLAQYAERVWNIKEGSIDEKANRAIEQTLQFLHSLDIKTRLSDYTDSYEHTAQHVQDTFEKRNWSAIGERKDLTPEDAFQIVKMSY